jgi:hypothetical protein
MRGSLIDASFHNCVTQANNVVTLDMKIIPYLLPLRLRFLGFLVQRTMCGHSWTTYYHYALQFD